jgi:hypothetical protein
MKEKREKEPTKIKTCKGKADKKTQSRRQKKGIKFTEKKKMSTTTVGQQGQRHAALGRKTAKMHKPTKQKKKKKKNRKEMTQIKTDAAYLVVL